MQMKVANTAVESEEVTISSLEELFPGIGGFPAGQAAGNAPEGVYVTLDQWAGFQAERRRITKRIRDDRTLAGPAGIENFVTITGDIHSYIAGYIKENYDDPISTGDNRPVGVELVCCSLTSSKLSEIDSLGFGAAPAPDAGQFTAAVTQSNPHIKFFNSNDHGYNVMEVTPESVLCTMTRVTPKTETLENRGSGIREPQPTNTQKETLRKFRVNAGEVLIFDETNGTPVPLPA